MLGVLQHSGDAAAMLARETLNRGQALFEGVERERATGERAGQALGRLGDGSLAVVAQLARQIAGLDVQRAHTLCESVQAWIYAGEGIQAAAGAGEHLHEGGRVGRFAGERVRTGAGSAAQRVQAAQALTGCEQLLVLVLALARGEGVDLGELILEQVELALTRAG